MQFTNIAVMEMFAKGERNLQANFYRLFKAGGHMDIYEKGLLRGLQCFFINNIGMLHNAEGRCPTRFTTRWVDSAGHISDLTARADVSSELAFKTGNINRFTLSNCSVCDADFSDVMGVEFSTKVPVYCSQYRFSNLLHPELDTLLDKFSEVMREVESEVMREVETDNTPFDSILAAMRQADHGTRNFLLQQTCQPERPAALPKGRFHIFLSHQQGDKGFVERLKADLEGAGFECWYDVDQLSAGDELVTDLVEAVVSKCEVAIFVCSKNFIRSRWTSYELLHAVNSQMASRGGRRLVPILLDGVPDTVIPPLLKPYVHIDFTRYHKFSEYNASVKRLIKSVQTQLSAIGL